jgi:hypothetical protein
MQSKVAIITFLEGGPVDPSYGVEVGGGHPSTGPVYPPGHPSAGLPVFGGGHPSHGLPGSPGHPSNRPPHVPPNVTWPPTVPTRPENTLPPELARPSNPIVLPEGEPLPAGSAFIAVYTSEKGWTATIVKGSGAQPKQ